MKVVELVFLTEEDRVFSRHILDISCQGRTTLHPFYSSIYEKYSMPLLRDLEKDGLGSLKEREAEVTDAGHGYLLRNECS